MSEREMQKGKGKSKINKTQMQIPKGKNQTPEEEIQKDKV